MADISDKLKSPNVLIVGPTKDYEGNTVALKNPSGNGEGEVAILRDGHFKEDYDLAKTVFGNEPTIAYIPLHDQD